MARAGFFAGFLKPCAVAAFLALVAACGGGGGGGEPVRTVTTVTVSSPTSTPKQGDTVQLTAVARDQFGDVVPGTTATWSSSAPTVATVSTTGLLQALAGGSVAVTATINSVPGTLTLTITPRVTTTVTVSSPTASPSVGETVQLTVVARDQFGDVLAGKAVSWSTSDANAATISATGLLQAVAPGTVVATATIDGLPGSLTLTVVPGAAASVTISSPTATPQAGTTVQLTAVVRDRDGNLVPGATVGWSTSDARIATVSASGLLLALTPGSVVTTATSGGVAGSVSLLVLGPPAAYFINGVEYAFDYQLDAQGRVDNYRISQREGIVYPVGPAGDVNVRECTGSLYGSYRCTGWYRSMTGEAGRIVAVEQNLSWPSSDTYSYGQFGLAEIKESSRLSARQSTDSTSTLSYDEAGRLSEVWTSSLVVSGGSETWNTTATIELDSQGRLLRAGIVTCSSWYGCRESSTAWAYDLAGFMSSAGTTTYSVDADGWLVSRQQESGTLDTYLITRSGGRVAEEQFTQAYPRMFYGGSRPQRVRYQLGRLPVEPLFVPRALTGLNGADYFGVISSHHR